MTFLTTRAARVLAAGATGLLTAVAVGAVGAAPASAVPLSCPAGGDSRSAADLRPEPGVVVTGVEDGERLYIPIAVDEGDSAYFFLPGGLDGTTAIVGAWENSTACNGDDLTRNGWAVTSRGAVYADGGAAAGARADYFGGANTLRLTRPIVGMSATVSGDGYWLVASDGGIFSYGDARFFGSTGNIRLNRPVVGMSGTPSGAGYWLVASDGGIFTYGDAVFRGSTGGLRLNQPIIGLLPTPSGGGYWLVARDGGVFTFGDAAFRGSLGGSGLTVNGIVPDGAGYALITDEGEAYGF
ncbi:hypothetical protein [Aquipuribacter hungaricus]|uniref:Uncharacterized protein n=1 Tax=Aquipuribacter hungaricus TaxID=545624 RepID=A0ABV7WG91_9MICO